MLNFLRRPVGLPSATMGPGLAVMTDLPETILQFGAGKFLRAFADLFIHQANSEGQGVGRVVVVQSTGGARADLLNRQHGRYHVLVRGLADGKTVDHVEEAASISRALVADTQWAEVLGLARSPDLRFIISNTTETGYTLDLADRRDGAPPRSFPAKLLLVLNERFQAGTGGLTMVPCELYEGNAELLRGLVLQLAELWKFPQPLTDWMESECRWLDTLVDRIVTGRPPDHPLLAKDALLTVAEPFAFWAVLGEERAGDFFRHPAIRRARDVRPFFLRKVRILNAAHTALVTRALPRGIATVREAIDNPEIRAWLDQLLFEEIVPTLEGRVEAPAEFARQTLERFRNPFLEHRLSDIALYHEAKVRIRLLPTRDEFQSKFGRTPPLLDEVIESAASWK
jgi:tagaturonate reductase